MDYHSEMFKVMDDRSQDLFVLDLWDEEGKKQHKNE